MPEGPQVKGVGNLIASFASEHIVHIEHPKSRKPWDLTLPVGLDSVEVVGKNIFIRLSNGQTIYNHLLMWGWWYPTHEQIGKKRLNTAFHFASGKSLGYFGGGILKLVTPAEADTIKSKLGPELMQSPDWQTAFVKVQDSELTIGQALLEQGLVAGIGNIYKSEGMFVANLHPLTRANQIGERAYTRLFKFLLPQMLADVSRRGPIVTTTKEAARAGHGNFVYRRRGQPCLLCATKIIRITQAGQGSIIRSTYFCPHCQPATPAL